MLKLSFPTQNPCDFAESKPTNSRVSEYLQFAEGFPLTQYRKNLNNPHILVLKGYKEIAVVLGDTADQ